MLFRSGEYTSLVFAGVLSFKDALILVKHRGDLMQEACETKPGGMVCVVGLQEFQVLETINEIKSPSTLNIANINAPDQIVISGLKESLDEIIPLIKKKGGRTITLKVAGAFHSFLMKSAEEKLSEKIKNTNFSSPRIPVICNSKAEYLSDVNRLKEALVEQLTSPVK